MTRQRGVTLIELMVALALLAIAVGVALPSLRSMVEGSAARAMNHRLHTALHQARTHAVMHSRRVVVCKTDRTSSCNSAAGWHDGWLVFEAAAGVNSCSAGGDGRCDHGGRILQVSTLAPSASLWIVPNNNVTNNVIFGPNGATNNNGRLTLCTEGDGARRGLVIASTGRVRADTPAGFLNCGL